VLSIITIARNEAAGLAGFLEHHRDLADEHVLVDTGSDDETVAIARQLGAAVHHFTWCDDFAAARNHSLEQARGDWVLCLDVDEFIDPADFAAIQQAARGQPTCYMLPQWNYYDQPQHQEWQPVTGRYPQREKQHLGFFLAEQYRLFPGNFGLRWEGRVHEDLAPAVKAAGLAKAALDTPIHHYGYVRGKEHNDQRNKLYGQLVRKKAEENPGDPKGQLELAYILVQEGQGRQAIPVLEAVCAQDQKGPVLERAQAMLASLYRADGRPDAAVQLLFAAVTDNPRWLFAWNDLLNLLMDQEHWEQAAAGLAAARDHCGEHALLLKIQCRLEIKTGMVVEAMRTARKVDGLLPGNDEFARIAEQCEELARKEGLI
jgi:tetratricopeptide (TPR) repeat protein